jgi:hypothetical protein
MGGGAAGGQPSAQGRADAPARHVALFGPVWPLAFSASHTLVTTVDLDAMPVSARLLPRAPCSPPPAAFLSFLPPRSRRCPPCRSARRPCPDPQRVDRRGTSLRLLPCPCPSPACSCRRPSRTVFSARHDGPDGCDCGIRSNWLYHWPRSFQHALWRKQPGCCPCPGGPRHCPSCSATVQRNQLRGPGKR